MCCCETSVHMRSVWDFADTPVFCLHAAYALCSLFVLTGRREHSSSNITYMVISYIQHLERRLQYDFWIVTWRGC